jgi:predicted dehydrogenase
MPDVRVGIVGLGGMGYNHAGSVETHGGLVVAGTDLRKDARREFAETFGAETYEDHAEMYDDAGIDAVIVTVPNKFHEPAVIDALKRDIAVLCEKPLAHTLDSAERMAAAADDADATCMVGFQSRFSTAATVFTEYRDAGRFGDLTHVEAEYVRRRGIPGVGSWFTDSELAGGGALIDIGVHAVDFALHLLDFPPVVEVSGVTRSTFGGRPDYANPDHFFGDWEIDPDDKFDVDDSASAFIRCEGATISLEAAWAANREPSHEVVVDGAEGGARMEIGGDTLHLIETGRAGTDHFVDSEVTGEMEHDGHDAEIAYFLDHVARDERPDMNTVDQALAVQRVLDGIYRSDEAGAAVRLDE